MDDRTNRMYEQLRTRQRSSNAPHGWLLLLAVQTPLSFCKSLFCAPLLTHCLPAHLPACNLVKFRLILRTVVRWHYYFHCRDKVQKAEANFQKSHSWTVAKPRFKCFFLWALCSVYHSNLAWMFYRGILFAALFGCSTMSVLCIQLECWDSELVFFFFFKWKFSPNVHW